MSNPLFKNRLVLVTAGPTREAIDNERYISNYSSGKMGYAIAAAFLQEGARVILVSGPVHLHLSHPHLHLIKVNTAKEMELVCSQYYELIDVAVFAASVAAYRPESVAPDRDSRNGQHTISLHMVKNVDIPASFGKAKTDTQVSVSLIAETKDILENTAMALDHNNLDMMIFNPSRHRHPVNSGKKKINIAKRDGSRGSYVAISMSQVTGDILSEISDLLHGKEVYDPARELALYETMYR